MMRDQVRYSEAFKVQVVSELEALKKRLGTTLLSGEAGSAKGSRRSR